MYPASIFARPILRRVRHALESIDYGCELCYLVLQSSDLKRQAQTLYIRDYQVAPISGPKQLSDSE